MKRTFKRKRIKNKGGIQQQQKKNIKQPNNKENKREVTVMKKIL